MNEKAYDRPEDAINAAMGKPVGVLTQPQPKEKQLPVELPPTPSTVELKYKYDGLAEDGRPVETIILSDVPEISKDKVLVIAWSPSLKKQIMSKVVPKIENV